jgi:hypothetical protein
MGIVCGRDRFGLPYSYPVQDLRGPDASRPPTLTLQVYLVTDQNFKVPHPTGETTGAGEGLQRPRSKRVPSRRFRRRRIHAVGYQRHSSETNTPLS